MKSEVYSWRICPEIKAALEEAAREQGTSIARLLEQVVSDWLDRQKAEAIDDEEQQRRMREEAMKYVGAIELGEGPYTAERIRERVRGRLKKRHAPTRSR